MVGVKFVAMNDANTRAFVVHLPFIIGNRLTINNKLQQLH
jgi:hypothetical protein